MVGVSSGYRVHVGHILKPSLLNFCTLWKRRADPVYRGRTAPSQCGSNTYLTT
ncbi:hypothetical protein FKP32DRAFT_1595945 [Trametes sanguinea]|nr:hypothetical protein FKP32DRAFT_1595945 [Trametes sanguinea]